MWTGGRAVTQERNTEPGARPCTQYALNKYLPNESLNGARCRARAEERLGGLACLKKMDLCSLSFPLQSLHLQSVTDFLAPDSCHFPWPRTSSSLGFAMPVMESIHPIHSANIH